MKIDYTVKDENVTLRQWVKHYFPHITYDYLQQSIRKGDVRINKQKLSPQTILNLGDVVSIWDMMVVNNDTKPEISEKHWENIPIVTKNENFWIIDKPYGVATQGGTKIRVSMVDILESWMERKPYVVHRLDRYTTGLLVVATNSYVARELSDSLQDRLWSKTYIAKIEGKINKTYGTIDDDVFGKRAITQYRLISSDESGSIVELNPITGRMHQLRQHCSKHLSPIIGDVKYGSKVKTDMYLRCTRLSFPFREKMFEYSVKE
jgi:23S rRNA pseudouridine955/2504/2580 synthase